MSYFWVINYDSSWVPCRSGRRESTESKSPKVHWITNHRHLQFDLIFSTLAAADIQLLVTRWSKWHDIYSRQVSDTISWRRNFILYNFYTTIFYCQYIFFLKAKWIHSKSHHQARFPANGTLWIFQKTRPVTIPSFGFFRDSRLRETLLFRSRKWSLN